MSFTNPTHGEVIYAVDILQNAGAEVDRDKKAGIITIRLKIK